MKRSGILLSALVLAGCSRGPVDPFTRVDVSGTVLVDGKPIEFGTITLTGAVNEQTQEKSQSVLAIRNGEFSNQNGGRGASAGKNQLTITIFESDPSAATAENPDVPIKATWVGEAEVQPNQPITLEISSGDLLVEQKRR